MKKVFFVTIILLFSFTMAYAESEISGDISTDVKDTLVIGVGGGARSEQDINVGGVDLQDTKVKGDISTDVKDTLVIGVGGEAGSKQDINVGGVKAK